MAAITLDHIRHAYGPSPTSPGDYALKEVDHTFEDGAAYALLGPSGCGKTTLLNIISGLVRPSEGRLLFDGRDVTDASTQARNIAQVFQFPVVYDTMTVAENLAFPLRNRKVPAAEIKTRVAEVLELIGLSAMAGRKAQRLNADQKQKISLGRGLVRADVAAILFDEPLTVIDPHMKWVLRSQLKHLHRQFGRTMIYVTHDQIEALTFADKVAVMYEGEIVQIGDAAELFDAPAHTFVGYFIGSPGMNVLPVSIDGRKALIGGQSIALPGGVKIPPGKKIELGVRPEHISLSRTGLPIKVTRIEDVGRRRIVRGTLGGAELVVAAPEDGEIPAEACVAFDPAKIGVFAELVAPGGWLMKPWNNKAWLLTIPTLVLVAFSAVIPLMTVVNYSVQDTFGNNVFTWVGVDWFRKTLHSERFLSALGRTLVFSAIILAIEIPLGVVIALRMPKKGVWASVCLVLVSLPLLIPFNVVGTIWQVFGRNDIGLLGATLKALGLDYNYVNNPIDAWATLVIMDVWHWTSLVVLLCYAGLASIPEAYYQAAQIDGASGWARFRYIQLPKLSRVLTIAILLRFMDSFMIYTEPLVVTGGGPGNATTFLSIDLVKMATGEFNLGGAGAMSLIYFLIILLLSWIFYTVMTRHD